MIHKEKKIVSVLIFTLAFLVVTPSIKAYAATDSLSSVPGTNTLAIAIEASPETPAPHTQTTIQVQSYTVDLNRALVLWLINGSKYSSGVGQTSIQIDSGAAGVTTNVTADIEAADGTTYQENLSLTPADVDITYQVSSYTPPFYEGKALFPYQGTITFIAMPNFLSNGTQLDPKTLVYTWKQDYSVLGSQSGFGKNSLTLQGNLVVKPMNISVTVSTLDNSITGVGTIVVNPQAPQVILYEDNPLYGVRYENALPSSFVLKNQEIKVRAAPYFSSSFTPHDDSAIAYKWQINGTEVAPTQDGTDSLVLRQTTGVSGQSIISVNTASADSNTILQAANSSATINF